MSDETVSRDAYASKNGKSILNKAPYIQDNLKNENDLKNEEDL